MDLDSIRYMINFQNVEFVLNLDGTWQLVIDRPCRLLDLHTIRCTVHNTPSMPKTCKYFNPYHCWYKRNFTTDDPPDLIRFTAKAFDMILSQVRFDENQAIVELPDWESLRRLTAAAAPVADNEAAAYLPLELEGVCSTSSTN
jgi:hypothetical protein